MQFQSTLPGWGATVHPQWAAAPANYFNPRSPDGERRYRVLATTVHFIISIHAPRMGSDLADIDKAYVVNLISIHAPRMGSDPGAARAP